MTPEKPEGTFRIAVLGASMDMGWGVRYQDTYVNRLARLAERRRRAPGRRAGRGGYEVLNFAVAAYSPLQRLETLRRKVLAFQPDLVIYSATTLDIRLMEIHLCDMLRKRVDLQYDFVREAVAAAGRRRRRPAGRRRRGADPQAAAQAEAEALLLGALRPDPGHDRGRMPRGGRAAGDGDHPAGRVGGRTRRAGPSRWRG